MVDEFDRAQEHEASLREDAIARCRRRAQALMRPRGAPAATAGRGGPHDSPNTPVDGAECADCYAPIAPARLAAVPGAALCIDCARRCERALK